MFGQLARKEMESVLASEITGHLGCHAGGRTYVVPISYAYREGYLYGFTGDGLKVRMMRENPKVCVEVERIESFAHWSSVVTWGEFQELHGEEASRALSYLYGQMLPHLVGDSEMTLEQLTERAANNGQGIVVYRIRIEEMTGRYEHFLPPPKPVITDSAASAQEDAPAP